MSVKYCLRIAFAALILIMMFNCKGGKSTIYQPPNNAPLAPSSPYPSHLATNVPLNSRLGWLCSDPDYDTIKCDLYFGTSSNPPLIASNLAINSYQPESLDYSAIYYWKVVVRDIHGIETAGPLWQFTTSVPVTRIAFSFIDASNSRIFTVKSDCSELHELTEENINSYDPAWSPDGLKIAYSSFALEDMDIFFMNSDGTNKQNIRQIEDSNEFDPAWSPDGTKIVFTSERDDNRDIYVMNSDGSNLLRLTDDPSWDWMPSWSPDGQKIAFSSNRGDGTHVLIYLMNTDGTNQHNITSYDFIEDDYEPNWSPDGMKIVFERHCHIWIMDSDGSNQDDISGDINNCEEFPSWSPDGTQIAFTSIIEGGLELYTMNLNRSNRRRITFLNGNIFDVAWAPYRP
jgi:Tol biopolymer transport system component